MKYTWYAPCICPDCLPHGTAAHHHPRPARLKMRGSVFLGSVCLRYLGVASGCFIPAVMMPKNENRFFVETTIHWCQGVQAEA